MTDNQLLSKLIHDNSEHEKQLKNIKEKLNKYDMLEKAYKEGIWITPEWSKDEVEFHYVRSFSPDKIDCILLANCPECDFKVKFKDYGTKWWFKDEKKEGDKV